MIKLKLFNIPSLNNIVGPTIIELEFFLYFINILEYNSIVTV